MCINLILAILVHLKNIFSLNHLLIKSMFCISFLIVLHLIPSYSGAVISCPIILDTLDFCRLVQCSVRVYFELNSIFVSFSFVFSFSVISIKYVISSLFIFDGSVTILFSNSKLSSDESVFSFCPNKSFAICQTF